MSSRHYVKRIYRVPKDRGATEYLAALVTKSLVKHGWPARWEFVDIEPDAFVIRYNHPEGREAKPDFWNAVSVAVRIIARTYRINVSESMGFVAINRRYVVTLGGHFKEER